MFVKRFSHEKTIYDDHLKERHDLETTTTFDCRFCQNVFKRRNHLKRHQASCRSQQSTQSPPLPSNNIRTQNTDPQPSRIPSTQPEPLPAQARSNKAKRQKPEMFIQMEQAMRGQLKSLRYNTSTAGKKTWAYTLAHVRSMSSVAWGKSYETWELWSGPSVFR